MAANILGSTIGSGNSVSGGGGGIGSSGGGVPLAGPVKIPGDYR